MCLLLVVATLAVYNPVNRNTFVNFDDDHYITNNPHVLAGLNWDTVRWAFSNFYEANWHPLTWISHALDCQLFGLNPVGHHYTNVFLHAVNAVLLLLLFQSATGFTWRSLMVAALFALHPVNVESVAWASERKNLLSMMFLLLAMQAYGWYASRPGRGRFALVAGLFACGLMSKPQVITLPFVLLLWDYWPLRRTEQQGAGQGTATGGTPAPLTSLRAGFQPARMSALLLEKVPLFLMSLASAVITMRAQKAGGAIHSAILYPLDLRLENAVVSYLRYIGNAFWPTNLSPLYPHPLDLLHLWQVFASGLILLVATGLVVRQRQRGYLLTGWFWFLGTLVPMIGLVQVGEQAMADRYAYLPFIGLFLIVCWVLAEWGQALRVSPVGWAIPAVLVCLMLGALTFRQIGYWRDSETLWSYALRVTSVRSYKAHFNLAMAYDQQGRYDDAILQLSQSIDPRGDDPRIHLGLGIYDQRHDHIQEAIAQYQSALGLTSDSALRADAYSNLGGAYRKIRDYEHARQSFAAALQFDPNKTMALVGMGLLEQRDGDFAQAIGHYSHAMAVEPTAVGYLLLAKALEKAGHGWEARAAYDKASQLTDDLEQAQRTAEELQAF
ncbi:MAG: tetratricopeptide repeat protein [Acidobacteriia bacterium]|nr:tetratricopeptide repeat protein [Terriglobia bacterium]